MLEDKVSFSDLQGPEFHRLYVVKEFYSQGEFLGAFIIPHEGSQESVLECGKFLAQFNLEDYEKLSSEIDGVAFYATDERGRIKWVLDSNGRPRRRGKCAHDPDCSFQIIERITSHVPHLSLS